VPRSADNLRPGKSWKDTPGAADWGRVTKFLNVICHEPSCDWAPDVRRKLYIVARAHHRATGHDVVIQDVKETRFTTKPPPPEPPPPPPPEPELIPEPFWTQPPERGTE